MKFSSKTPKTQAFLNLRAKLCRTGADGPPCQNPNRTAGGMAINGLAIAVLLLDCPTMFLIMAGSFAAALRTDQQSFLS
jgi:hypothetical protein